MHEATGRVGRLRVDRPAMVFAGATALLTLIAAAFYDAIPDLPLAPQSDEPKKASFVLTGQQDFLHPILMLQVVRLANLIFGYQDVPSVAGLGRSVAAVFGGLTVLATVLLARRIAGPPLALAAGVLAAVTPLLALHAQLFKEDVFVAPFILLAIAALDRLRERHCLSRATVFGLTAGLAMATKYIGVVVLLLAVIAPLVVPVGATLLRYYGAIALAALLALATFAVVNMPAWFTPAKLAGGLGAEIDHALTGHVIIWHGIYSHFLFHWHESLLPGAGMFLTFAAIAGAVAVLWDRRASPPAIRLVLVFAVGWYLLHEASPMKPFMAIERHMTVMAGLLALLAVYLVSRLAAVVAPQWSTVAAAAAIMMLALPNALFTLALVRSTENDTRLAGVTIAQALDAPAAVDWHASMPSYSAWPPLSAIGPATEYAVIAQPIAERFVRATAFPNQPENVRDTIARYGALLERPSIAIRSTAGSFSYRNVPVRIVAVRGGAERLEAALAKARTPPHIEARVLPGGR